MLRRQGQVPVERPRPPRRVGDEAERGALTGAHVEALPRSARRRLQHRGGQVVGEGRGGGEVGQDRGDVDGGPGCNVVQEPRGLALRERRVAQPVDPGAGSVHEQRRAVAGGRRRHQVVTLPPTAVDDLVADPLAVERGGGHDEDRAVVGHGRDAARTEVHRLLRACKGVRGRRWYHAT